MAPVRKAVASAATAVAVMAAVASCTTPGSLPGGGHLPSKPTTSASATAVPPDESPTSPSAPVTSAAATPTSTAPAPTRPPAVPDPAPTTTRPPTTRPPAPTTQPPATQPPAPTAPPATTPPAAPPAGGSKQDEIVRLTNVERSKAGCGPLAVDTRLTAAAQAHTADMAANNYFSHTGRNGSSLGDRVRAAGFPFASVGENIAAGNQTAAQTMAQWMGSTGHRANILNCSYTLIGVGYAEGGSYRYYWTQDFGRL